MTEQLTLTKLIRMYPNATMRKFIDKNIIYRNELWNRCLTQWEYDYRDCQRHIKWITFIPHKNKHKKITVKEIKHYSRKYPSDKLVRHELSIKKSPMDYLYPSGILDGVTKDLQKSFDAFFDPKRKDAGFPKYKRKNMDQGSYKDHAAKIVNGKLQLTMSRKYFKKKYLKSKNKQYKSHKNKKNKKQNICSNIRLAESVPEQFQNKSIVVQVVKKANKYYVAIHFQPEIKQYLPTGQVDGIDVNVGHFNSAGICLNILPKSLNRQYNKIKCYNRQMAHKRNVNGRKQGTLSKNYKKVKTKLNRAYERMRDIQKDIVNKYANYLTRNRDRVTIEDLNVKAMLMGHIASKGVHRSMFRYFRDAVTYMGKLYGCEIVFANRLFASTQECPRCHYIKIHEDKITLQGNKKHRTEHNQFVCYNCGYTADRDDSAYQSLANYDGDASYEWYKQIRKNEETKWKQDHNK